MNLFIKSICITPGLTRYYVADSNGRKVFPGVGCTDKAQCEDFISGGPGAIGWIEFNILAEIKSLEAVAPDHYLVKAVGDACKVRGAEPSPDQLPLVKAVGDACEVRGAEPTPDQLPLV